MEQLLQDIWGVLQYEDIWDLFIYIIFFMSLIMMMLIPDKNLQPTLLMSAVLLFTVIDKVRPETPSNVFFVPGFDDRGFGTFMIHIGMFVFPLIAGALVRGRTDKDKRALPLGILTGIIAGVYTLLFVLENNGIGIL